MNCHLLPILLVLPTAAVAAALAVAQVDPPEAVLAREEARIETMARASSATIAVFQQGGEGGGSGVIISPDGYALTNFHVTMTGPALECGLADGSVWPAVIVGIDPVGDVALIKLIGRDDFPHAPLGDSDHVHTGDWVFAAGNPFLLAENFQPSISYGIVSGTNRYQYPAGTLLEYADCIQTDAAINPGNSGGPLFNLQGEIVGINGRGSFEKRGRVNVGVGYAISINQIKRFIGYLKSGRIVDHATLGATVVADQEGRILVENILETSDAYRRGLRYDDEIVRLGDRDITTVNGFKNVLGTYPKGWRIPLIYRREGKTYDVLVRLTGAHREGELIERMQQFEPQMPGGPPEDPDNPQPQPAPQRAHARQEIPPEIAKLYEERRGFANYHFNEQHLKRIFAPMELIEGAPSTWSINGRVVAGGNFSGKLGPRRGSMLLPFGEFHASYGGAGELTENLTPPGTGGLLQALHLWQRLITVGHDRFGELVYRGTMPMLGSEEWMHVVDAVYGGVELQLYFDPDTYRLVGLEMFADEYSDPCEIYFSEYRTIEGHTLPYRWDVRYGNRIFAVLEIDAYLFEASGENAGDGDPAENRPSDGASDDEKDDQDAATDEAAEGAADE